MTLSEEFAWVDNDAGKLAILVPTANADVNPANLKNLRLDKDFELIFMIFENKYLFLKGLTIRDRQFYPRQQTNHS